MARALTLVCVSAILAGACAFAGAAVVTVTPDNMQGWSIEAYRQGMGAIVPYGPASYEGGTPWDSKENGNGTNLGRGAFYATCHPSQGCCGTTAADKTPSTVWLGTDTLGNGQSLVGIELSRITRLTYYVFVSQNPWRTAGSTWEDWSSWRCPRQPIMVGITCVAPDGSDRRTFYCRPWGSKTIGDDNCQTYRPDGRATHGLWEYHDCLLIGRPGVAWGTWWDPWANKRYSWAEIADPETGIFRNYKLAPTSEDPWPTGYKSPGWDTDTDPQGTPHSCNGTGKCINLMVGARKRMVKWPEEPNTGVNWWWESAAFRGHVDHFTIGIDGVDTTFDFEPSLSDPKPQKVLVNGDALTDPIAAGGTVPSHDPEQRKTQDCFLFRAVGTATSDNAYQFTLNLASPLPYLDQYGVQHDGIRVVTWPNMHLAVNGETWAVTGYIERLRFGTNVPLMVWTDINHCQPINP